MTKRTDLLSKILFFIAAAALAAVLFMTVNPVKEMSDRYRKIASDDLSDGFNGTIWYDDHLYAVLGHGSEIMAEDPDRQAQFDRFLTSSLHSIDERVYGASVLYTMMISALTLLEIREGERNRILKTVLFVCAIYALILIAFIISCLFFKVPVYPPSLPSLTCLAIGLLSVIGGDCAVLLLLEKIRYKKVAAILIVPLIFILFLFTTSLETMLYSPAHVDSFAYLTDSLSEEQIADAYYDEDQNIIVYQGKGYGPEQVPNEEHLKGSARIGALLLETIDPYSGNAIEIVRQINGLPIPIYAILFYTSKALIWIFLSKFMIGRRRI